MKNPILSLYAFHLRQTFDDAPNTASQDAATLWESLTEVGQILSFPELQSLKSQLISYSPDERGNYQYNSQQENDLKNEWLTHHGDALELTPIPTSMGFKIKGTFQPFRLHDTYCADITLSPEIADLDIAPEQLSAFNPPVLIEKINANLGKVIVLHGEQNYWTKPKERDAEKWVNVLCANTHLNPRFVDEGELFNCPCFLFEAEDVTIIISLAKPKQLDLERANANYDWLRDLFWSQKKVDSTYKEAQKCYQAARHLYSTLEAKVQDFYVLLNENPEKRLDCLDALLKTIPKNLLQYNCYIRDLKAHRTTIATNLVNFNNRLKRLRESENTFNAWLNYSNEKYPRHLAQIQTYIHYLEPGKDLFGNLINTIRATVEVEQAQREKELQNHLQSIGIGIAAGAIVASSSGLIVQPKTERIEIFRMSLHPFIWSLMLSAICAIGFWGIAEVWLGRKKNG
ncbi:hypothetical protein IQ249_16320 [Lusitaniella coriacea LEGE 07157]|uniref:Uncharacterized protein n=1 Tax=Lusitaniella coriacea LEGE 07157 TaxID=945747 RepID=A0A8J7IUD0_9CYAN|nr:hypothetical protein [Lusitaniella coriacea]MBE9117467.1 hypothetical protein [Lusitaniella coriacea LEGE 07157]